MADCNHYRELLSGLLDGELSTEETAELNEHLIRCASCRSDYEELGKTEHTLKMVPFVEPTDQAAMALWKLPYSRTARNAALLMVVGGYLLLILYALFTILTNGSEGFVPRLALGAILIGLLVLLGMLGIERLQTYQKDPYKEIRR